MCRVQIYRVFSLLLTVCLWIFTYIVDWLFVGLFKSLGRLFTNPLYLLVMLANCTAGYYTSGWTGFLPKYFETVFNFSSSDASIYGGI